MKAAVFHGQRDLRLEDVPEQEIRPGSVRVQVDWCGICGSDLHEYLAGPILAPAPGSPHPISQDEIPITFGHEFAGEVIEVGDGAEFGVGERVAIEPVYRCGECPVCRRGAPNLCNKLGFYGLSERAVVPDYMVHRLPDGLTTEQGALVEPIAVGLRAVRRSGIEAGQSALVFGAGPIGAVTVQCLKAAGAGMIAVAEVAEARKKKALEIGADHVIDPTQEDVVERVRELTGGDGMDVCFDAAGIEQTFQTALKAVRKSGTVVNIAIWEGEIRIHPNLMVLGELNIAGTIAYTPQDFADTISMLRDGRIRTEGIITERIPLSDVVEGGFEELVDHKDRHVKILVRSHE